MTAYRFEISTDDVEESRLVPKFPAIISRGSSCGSFGGKTGCLLGESGYLCGCLSSYGDLLFGFEICTEECQYLWGRQSSILCWILEFF